MQRLLQAQSVESTEHLARLALMLTKPTSICRNVLRLLGFTTPSIAPADRAEAPQVQIFSGATLTSASTSHTAGSGRRRC